MFPSPEILGLKLNWFELITAISILLTLLFGSWFYYYNQYKDRLASFVLPLLLILVVGYISTYLIAYVESQLYFLKYSDDSYLIAFGQAKKFIGFIFFLFLLYIANLFIGRLKSFERIADFLAVVICFFIILETNACLFDGHGCYGRFTNLPWGMLFLHGSAPTLLPVHPTPIYISISHLVLLAILFYLFKKDVARGQLILILFIGTAISNVFIESFKDSTSLWLGLNFSQLLYGIIGLSSLVLIGGSKYVNFKS